MSVHQSISFDGAISNSEVYMKIPENIIAVQDTVGRVLIAQ